MIRTAVLLLLACGTRSSAAPTAPVPAPPTDSVPAPPTDEEPAMSIASTEGLPAELAAAVPVWEHLRADPRTKKVTSTRLYDDGRVYTWSDQRRVEGANGVPKREAAAAKWRLDAKVSEAGLGEVRAALAGAYAGLGDAPPADGADAPDRVLRGVVGGAVHTVRLRGDPPPAVTDVDQALQRGVIPGAVPIDNGP